MVIYQGAADYLINAAHFYSILDQTGHSRGQRLG
jgi:hypothetical protein